MIITNLAFPKAAVNQNKKNVWCLTRQSRIVARCHVTTSSHITCCCRIPQMLHSRNWRYGINADYMLLQLRLLERIFLNLLIMSYEICNINP